MNLGRAKLILIVAFFGLNLFLGYQLFWPDFGRLTRVAVTTEELRIAEGMLNKNNYFLAASLDRSVQTIDFLSVSPSAEFQQLIRELYTTDEALVNETEEAVLYSLPGELVVINLSGLIQIIYSPGVPLRTGFAELELREQRNAIEAFLNERMILPKNAVFNLAEATDGGQEIFHYYQVVDEIPVYAGQLRVFVNAERIAAVEIYWLEPVERVPARETEVISPTEALTNLVKELGPSVEPRQIIQVDLGYFSGEYDAEKWEMPPVWRVVLDNDQYYYVNAFTGNLEQDIIIPRQLP
jgi:regulatory protein YycI of two-component signal transduction system YycFG